MPVAGMRRTRRVFGVVKSGDGARILRSGRKIWSDPEQGKLKKSNSNSNSARDEWFKLLDEDDQNKGWCSQAGVRKAEARPELSSGGWDLVFGMDKASEMTITKVYERKRKRFDWDEKMDYSAGFKKGCGLDRMFGIHFVRRQRRNKSVVESDDVDGDCRPGLIIRCTGYISVGWLPRFLNSILAYLMKGGIKLSKLHEFLSSNPIGSVLSSHGIQILQECSAFRGAGICKIFGAPKFAPSFSVNFSAIPTCFVYIHSSMLLHSEILLFAYLENVSRKFDDKALNGSSEILFCITSGDQILENKARRPVNNFRKRSIVHLATEGRRVARHPMRLRNSFSSSNIRGKRSSPRNMRGRYIFAGVSFQKSDSCVLPSGFQKTNNDAKLIDSSLAEISCKISDESHSFGLSEELNGSPLGWRSSDTLALPVSHKLANRSGQNDCGRNTGDIKVTSVLTKEAADSTSCAANILVIDHDKCYRQEGASVMLEQSPSNRWLIVVKKDGFTKYSHVAELVMKPCTFNRVTRAIIWTVNDGMKLEFPSRDDWYIFKEFYKVGSLRNLQTPADKFIPVPGVHPVSNYEDTITASYSRPVAYISLYGNELSRLLAKRTASYDLDSEDEEWLAKYNEEVHVNNESHQNISSDTFELMIDAIEKAFYLNPCDYLDERSIADVCPELGHEGAIEVVYNYWSKKRNQKCPSLVRVLQAHKPRKCLNIGGRILRKKRSFKCHGSQNGRGKQRFLEVIGARNDDVGKQLSIMEVEDANSSATRYSELAFYKRKRAQALMGSADLATYKAAMALKIAQAGKDISEPGTATSMILI